MNKTKLQIMREKKGLTIEQLAQRVKNIGILLDERFIYRDILYAIVCHEKRYQFGGMPRILEETAQALGCSLDELVEE